MSVDDQKSLEKWGKSTTEFVSDEEAKLQAELVSLDHISLKGPQKDNIRKRLEQEVTSENYKRFQHNEYRFNNMVKITLRAFIYGQNPPRYTAGEVGYFLPADELLGLCENTGKHRKVELAIADRLIEHLRPTVTDILRKRLDYLQQLTSVQHQLLLQFLLTSTA